MAADRNRVSRTQAPRRRRGLHIGRLLALFALAVVALLLVGGAACGACSWTTRPAAITITAEPKDATITIVGPSAGKAHTWEASSTLAIGPATPGAGYLITVSRTGYAPVESFSVKPSAGQSIDQTVKLRALPVALDLSVRPETATWTVTPAESGGSPESGAGSTTRKLSPGRYSIAVTAAGSTPLRRDITLEPGKSVTFTAWLDPSGQLVHKIAVFSCVPAPKGVAVSPDNKQVWVTALVTQPSIAAYDPATGRKLGSVNLGKNGAVEVIFNKAGTRAYASQMQSASVFEIDTAAFRVLRTFRTKSVWTKVVELSPDEKTLYAANWSGNDVSVIDLMSGKLVRNIPTVETPRGLYPTPDGKRLFVAGFGEKSFTGRLAVIDLATNKSKTFFTERHGAMRHMVGDPATGRLYTSDMGRAVVWVTDMTTLTTEKLAKVDSHPNTIALSPDGKVLFVSCRGANNPTSYNLKGPEWGSILLLDASTGKPLDAIIGGNQCTALALSRDGKLLVFSDFLDARLRSYEIPPYGVLVAGGGGLYPAHFKMLRRPGWADWIGGSGSTGGAN